MSRIKELTVFTLGDSAKISTWSNVPYFFTETFIAKGVKVNRVDISPIPVIEKIYNNSVLKLFKWVNWNPTLKFYRTHLNYLFTQAKIRKATKKYSSSDANVFMTFSFSSGTYKNKYSILFHDWTYHHYFDYFENRKPHLLEQRCMNREDKHIRDSNLILPLFPGIAQYMKSRYKDKNVVYLGNVINSEIKVNPEEIIEQKLKSNTLLFVGSEKYIDAARLLVKSFDILSKGNSDFELHIIGIEKNKLPVTNKGVICHGYLDKGEKCDRELYYDLFRRARVFINTDKKWGAFSATVEAMYFYIPVLVAPYDEFTKTFGDEIDVGMYSNSEKPEDVATKIATLTHADNYKSLCINAHKAVKDFTWDAYIDKVLNTIQNEMER